MVRIETSHRPQPQPCRCGRAFNNGMHLNDHIQREGGLSTSHGPALTVTERLANRPKAKVRNGNADWIAYFRVLRARHGKGESTEYQGPSNRRLPRLRNIPRS